MASSVRTFFFSRGLLAACFFVMLLSAAIDQYPGETEPRPLEYDYDLHSREQESRYNETRSLIRDTELFDAPILEHLFINQSLSAEDLVVGPDDRAYVGLADGRLASFQVQATELRNFSRTGQDVAGCGALDMEPTCGRPLGLAFAAARPFAKFINRIPAARLFPGDQVLLVADAYKGVLLFDANGQRTLLFSRVGEQHVNFLNGLAVVQETGEIYVTESSRRFQRNQVVVDFLERRPTGYLLRFDPRDESVQVEASDLGFPNGLTLDKDGTGLLIALMFQNKIVRFDRTTKQMKDFAFLPGEPDNVSIEKVGAGETETSVLMVGLVSRNDGGAFDYVKQSVKTRKMLSVLPTWATVLFIQRLGVFVSLDLETGEIRHVYEASRGQTPIVSGAKRFGDHIYLTSWSRSSLTRIPAAMVQ
uniref:Strictosidine synthase conserved region domain-containing protein n=1 Tax=Peronospora matthiolae TaxID=2874970 RepID=A0AAV1TMZ3_9STRA